ncbi:mce related protein [Dissulfurispira thermophila]|uniref:Mce related protein n=2 Tax=root TaxID=1 RepID=A0A7G1GZW9_9BACT|nr:MlaD family protein [Dissulfurispira thermophila]BCB96040.1 mce related protein [Dissulfurispira thermophila]
MELMKETDKRFIGIEKKIGLFVIIAIVGIIVVTAFIGVQQGIFTPKTTIYFIADSGQGINEGMAVKLSGFKIGKVSRLSLDDVAKVKVELSINTRYMKWIRTDSKARLFKEGFIGDSIIEITPGSITAKHITENGTIEFERARGLAEIAEELKNEIKPVLGDVKEIIHYINNPQGDVKQTLQNLKKFSDSLSETQQHLNALLKDADKGVNTTVKKIDSVLDSTKQTVNNIDGLIKKVDNDIPNILEKTNKSLENIQKTTEEIKKVTEQTAPQIPSAIKKGGEAAEGAKDITDSVKKIWPIRLFIKEPEQKTLNTDSYE